MYNQFIIFIVALFLCATYQTRPEPGITLPEAMTGLSMLLVLFLLTNRLAFRIVEKRIHSKSLPACDRAFENAVMRQTIAALIAFSISLYLLRIPDFLMRISLFTTIPTLTTVVCLCIFLVFLALMYNAAHPVYTRIYHQAMKKGSYIRSHLAFCIPVVLPWLVLSLSSDLLLLLPFERLNEFLASPAGELTFFIFFIFFIASVGPFFIQKLWRCKPLEPGYRRERIDRLCQSAAVEYRDILYWTLFGGKMITAGVMGLVRRFRYILLTPTLVNILNDDEIDAVMAHEIGHVKLRHMLFYIFFFVGYVLLSYVVFHAAYYAMIFFGMSAGLIFQTGASSTPAIPLLFNAIFVTSFILYFRFVFGYFMRNFERQADGYVYRLFPTAASLISSLEKIALVGGIPRDKPSWHHFSISERIDHLRKCEEDRGWIIRHNKKVKTAVIAYFIVLAGLVGLELGLNATGAGAHLDGMIIEKVIMAELDKRPGDPLLHGSLGDLYQHRGKYEKALIAYEKSLALNPDDPNVLNNMAWLLATCRHSEIRNPEKAVRLAEKAASIDPSPHILDTLAESYYSSGRTDKAVAVIRMAIDTAGGDKRYYLNQLDKFKSAK